MANETITVNYVGRDAGKYISKATLGAKTISGGYITPILDVDGDTFIHQIDITGDILQEYNEVFSARGGYSYTDRKLSPKQLMVNLEFSKNALLKSWEREKMRGAAMDKTVPSDFLTYVQDQVQKKVNASVEKNIWQGQYAASGGTLQKFDGLISQILAADSIKITGTTAVSGFTKVNIATVLGDVYDSLPAEVSEEPDFKLYVSPTSAKIYRRYLGTENVLNNESTVGKKPLDFEGVEVVPTDGFPDAVCIGLRVSNIFFGTNVLSDLNQMRVIDMESVGDDVLRVKLVFFACTNFGYANEIAIYKK